MLNKINQNNSIILMLSSIILNYILLLIPSLIFVVKLNIFFFFLLNFFYFYKLNKDIFLLIFIIVLIIICLGSLTYQWDARSLWLFKAKRIFIDESIISIKDNYALFSHPDYPNIGPAFIAGFSKLIGYWNEVFPKLALTLMYIPALIILNKYFKNNSFLLVIWLVFFAIGKFTVNGEMDGLLSIYFTLSVLTIYNLIIQKEESFFPFLTTILLIIILSLLKNEGFILALILLFISATTLIYKKQMNYKIIFFFILALVPGSIWQLFTMVIDISNDNTPYNYNFENFSDRIVEIKNYFLICKYVVLNEKFLLSVIFFIIVSYFSKNISTFIFGITIILIYTATLFIAYLSTPLDLEWHLSSSATRVIKPMILFLFIFSVYNINNKNKVY